MEFYYDYDVLYSIQSKNDKNQLYWKAIFGRGRVQFKPMSRVEQNQHCFVLLCFV